MCLLPLIICGPLRIDTSCFVVVVWSLVECLAHGIYSKIYSTHFVCACVYINERYTLHVSLFIWYLFTPGILVAFLYLRLLKITFNTALGLKIC